MNLIVKASLVVALAGCAITNVCVAQADAANFSGRWNLRGSIGFLPANGFCSFRQSGNTLSGYCISLGSRAVAHGSVNGLRVVWHVRNPSTRGAFYGTLVNPGLIRGQWTTSLAPGVGAFIATRG